MSPQVSTLATTTQDFARLSLDLVDRPELEQQIEKQTANKQIPNATKCQMQGFIVQGSSNTLDKQTNRSPI